MRSFRLLLLWERRTDVVADAVGFENAVLVFTGYDDTFTDTKEDETLACGLEHPNLNSVARAFIDDA